jgi:hypothetical protein
LAFSAHLVEVLCVLCGIRKKILTAKVAENAAKDARPLNESAWDATSPPLELP